MTGPIRIVPVDAGASFWDDTADLAGSLRLPRPEIPVRYGYDELGSELFEEITELPNYYLTRVEQGLLQSHGAEIAEAIGSPTVAELGSGSAKKTRLLLAACMERRATRYVPIDVSEEMLRASAQSLTGSLPGLRVEALWGRYAAGLAWLRGPDPGTGSGTPLALVFLGSTLGSMTAAERGALLSDVAATLRPGDRFLLGVDLDKPGDVFEQCYNDPPGRSTFARFRLNHLTHLNARFGADFAVDRFFARARYDAAGATVEGRVFATEDQSVEVPELGVTLRFARGDWLVAGRSVKFHRPELVRELAGAGFGLDGQWIDPVHQYGIFLFARSA